MNKLTGTILLLDSISRKYVKTSVSDIDLMGVKIVNNFNEITTDMCKYCQNIIILESYLQNQNSYSDLRLFKALLPMKFIFIGVNSELLDTLTEYGMVYRADPTLVDYSMIQSAIYQDSDPYTSDFEEHKYNDNFSFANMVVEDNTAFDTEVVNLATEYISCISELQNLKESSKKLKKDYHNLQEILIKREIENEKLTLGFADMMKNAVSLNKTLKEYERVMTQDIYDKVNLLKYPNAPVVIYFKEIEELIHQNSFIETIFDVIRLQGRQSVKVLRLYDSVNCRKIKALPDYYLKLRNRFLNSDIITSDFIVKVGDYRGILDILLTNKTSLDILIIIDCKAYDDIVISGAPIIFNLCRNYNNLDAYGLDSSNTIVNSNDSENHVLSWGHYEEISEALSKEEQFLCLSSKPVIQTIFEFFRTYINSV